MANKKDVQLVLTAKDANASKVVDQFVQTLQSFVNTQDDVAAGAAKVGAMFGRLGAEVGELSKDLQALNNLKQATASFDAMRASVSRLEETVRRQKTTTAGLVADYGKAAEATKRYEDAATKAAAAVAKQQSEIAQTRAALEQLQGRQRGAAASAKVFESAELKTQTEQLKTLQKEMRTANSEVAKAKTRQETLRASAVNATKALDEQRAGLTTETAELRKLGGVIDAARNKLGLAATDHETLGAAATRTAANIEKVNAALKLQATSTPTNRQAALGLQDSQVLNQMAAVRTAREEWERARAEATRLGAAMAKTTQPTREMQSAFAASIATSKLAQQEYRKQAQALNTLRGITSSGSFAQFQQRISGSMDATPVRQISGAFQQLNGTVRKSSSAFNELYGASRKSMSLFQRIRGEVLALSASFVGLYAAFSQVDQTIKAFQTLEAVQNRLGAVFEGNTQKVAAEVRFLREEAIRLGTSFQVLGDEYSKLAVATDAAGFSQESTRKIFLSVAEAGRVNKLSMENMSGIFLALQQMISKGKVSAEELQRQLGDRLPGAVNIMANALDMSVSKMLELMQAGQLFADEQSMLKFADELTERFGSQLPAALQSMTTQMQRFQAIVFERRMQVGEGGFAAALQEAFSKLNAVLSGEGGDKLVRAMTNAMTGLVNVSRIVIENFSTLTTILQGFVALKVGQFFLALIGNIKAASVAQAQLAVATAAVGNGLNGMASRVILTNMGQLHASIRALQAAVAGLATSFSAARVGMVAVSSLGIAVRGVVVGLTTAFRALWVAVGGWIGVAVVALSYLATELMGSWLTGVSDATDALAKHRELMEEVKAGYEEIRNGAKQWSDVLKDANKAGLTLNGERLKKELDTIRKDVSASMFDGLFDTGREYYTRTQFQPFLTAFSEGRISAQELKDGIDGVIASGKKLDVELATKYRETAIRAVQLTKDLKENAAALDLIDGKSVEASKAVLSIGESVADIDKTFENAKGAEKFAATIEKLTEAVPELASEMERLKKIGELDAAMKALAPMATTPGTGAQWESVIKRYNQARDAVNIEAFSGGSKDPALRSTVALLKELEGFRSSAYFDVNAYRAGYGSDTVTLDDKSVKAITAGMTVTEDDAMRDLVRRVQTEFMPRAEAAVGKDQFERFSADQKAVLASLTYNFGKLPEGVANAIKSGGTTEQIAAAIRQAGSQGANASQLQGRRNAEAALFSAGTSDNAASEAKRQIAADRFLETLRKQNEQRQFESQLAMQTARQQEISKALREAELEAQKSGVALSKEQRAAITESVAKNFDALNREKQLEAEIGLLTERRKSLMEQITYYQNQGMTGAAEALKNELTAVNSELLIMIDRAIKAQQALGGPEAQKAILALQSQRREIAATEQHLVVTAKQMNDLFADGATSAFDKFAEDVANGESAIQSLRDSFLQFAADFLREIAKMIMQQAILNALSSGADGGGGFGSILSGGINGLFGAGVMHTGGVVGSAPTRAASPAWFSNAMRYHGGGIAGLRPDEVPTILQKGEEVLTASDPRHRMNGGAQGNSTKVINTFDASSFLSEALNTKAGEQIILNFVRANPAAFKQALGT